MSKSKTVMSAVLVAVIGLALCSSVRAAASVSSMDNPATPRMSNEAWVGVKVMVRQVVDKQLLKDSANSKMYTGMLKAWLLSKGKVAVSDFKCEQLLDKDVCSMKVAEGDEDGSVYVLGIVIHQGAVKGANMEGFAG